MESGWQVPKARAAPGRWGEKQEEGLRVGFRADGR